MIFLLNSDIITPPPLKKNKNQQQNKMKKKTVQNCLTSWNCDRLTYMSKNRNKVKRKIVKLRDHSDIQIEEWRSFRIITMKTNTILDSIPCQVRGLILAVCFLMNSYGTYIVIWILSPCLMYTNRFEDRLDDGRQAFFFIIRGTPNVFA